MKSSLRRGHALGRLLPPGALVLGACASAWLIARAPSARADATTLATVGAERIERADFERRAALLAPFQWRSLGASWPEQRRALLERVLVEERLLGAAAEAQPRALLGAQNVALARALREAIYAETARQPIPRAELEAFYARERRHFEEPERLALFRILVADEAAARALIAELGTPDATKFRKLARERSLDTATHLRAGNLGYVASDGQSHLPQLRVAPALYEAAARVKDGELVPVPVPEAGRFAVVWRRASHAARVRTLAEVEPEIAAALIEQRYFAALGALTERLRQAELSQYRPELLDDFEPPQASVQTPARARRAAAAPALQRAAITPKPGDRGLR